MAEQLLDLLRGELASVKKGRESFITGQEWLALFRLDGKEPDGMSLAERLIPDLDGKNAIGMILHGLGDSRKLVNVLKDMEHVVHRIVKKEASEAEEKLAKELSLVAIAQITREREICPTAMTFATGVYLAHPEYFPEEAERRIIPQLAIAMLLMARRRGMGSPRRPLDIE